MHVPKNYFPLVPHQRSVKADLNIVRMMHVGYVEFSMIYMGSPGAQVTLIYRNQMLSYKTIKRSLHATGPSILSFCFGHFGTLHFLNVAAFDKSFPLFFSSTLCALPPPPFPSSSMRAMREVPKAERIC